MKPSKLILLFCATLLHTAATAQSNNDSGNFGLWTEIATEHDFTKQLSVEGSIEMRTEENFDIISRWGISAGLGYKVCKYLKIAGGYAFLYDRSTQENKVNFKKNGIETNGYNVDHGYWRNKHRVYFDLTGKLPISFKEGKHKLTFSLRERYQFTRYMATNTLRDRYRDEFVFSPGTTLPDPIPDNWGQHNGFWYTDCEFGVPETKNAKNRHYLRSRIAAEYDIKKCPFTPSASVEFSNNLNEAFDLDKKRFTLEVDWKVTKQHRLSIGYLYQTSSDDDNTDNLHAVKLGYKFKF